jgi:hypothetical protein
MDSIVLERIASEEVARHLDGRIVDPVVHGAVVWAVEQRLLEELTPALDTRLAAMLAAGFDQVQR